MITLSSLNKLVVACHSHLAAGSKFALACWEKWGANIPNVITDLATNQIWPSNILHAAGSKFALACWEKRGANTPNVITDLATNQIWPSNILHAAGSKFALACWEKRGTNIPNVVTDLATNQIWPSKILQEYKLLCINSSSTVNPLIFLRGRVECREGNKHQQC